MILGALEKEINYFAGPVATEAHESPAVVKLAWGPLGTAKTTWGCWRIFFKAMIAAEGGYSLRAICVRDTYRNLADSTLRTFLFWFPDAKDVTDGPSLGYTAQSQPVNYKIYVGGRYHDVSFRHGQTEQDASMFLSTEYDVIFLEEIAPAYLPGEKKVSPGIAEGVFDMALARLTREVNRAAAIGPELIMTCNSPPLTHWASKRVIDKTPEYLKMLNWAHWMFPISDNAHNLRPDYYSSLEMAWEGRETLIKRFLKGERIVVFIGDPRFNLDQLDEMLHGNAEKKIEKCVATPDFQGYLRSTKVNLLHVQLVADPKGWVKMWVPPRINGRYLLGADSAAGLPGRDYSSGHVLDMEDLSIVATFHGHLEPVKFADELAKLGYLYNRAMIGVETFPSMHGGVTMEILKERGYPRLYWSKQVDTRTKKPVQRLGWHAIRGSKHNMIDGLANHLEDGGQIVDADTIGELQTFGQMLNGRLEAQSGCFDDRVISYGVAIEMHKKSGLESLYPSLG